MGGPPEELRTGLLDDTRRQSSRTNSTRVVASMVVGIIPSPVDHSKVTKSATRTHASHCKRAPSPTTKVTIRPNPLGRHPNTETRVECYLTLTHTITSEPGPKDCLWPGERWV
ncbi:unnamed protein product [Arctogadus glacialis]